MNSNTEKRLQQRITNMEIQINDLLYTAGHYKDENKRLRALIEKIIVDHICCSELRDLYRREMQ